jgi:hypothetical protein
MGRGRVLVVWLLVTVLGTLASVAYATPPDPTYFAGFWDDDDYDNVVTLASHRAARLIHTTRRT